VIDRQDVRDLYDDYVAYLDEGDFEAWLDLFTEDGEYRLVARENFERGLPLATMRCDSRSMLADRLVAIRSTQMFAPRALRRFVSGIRLHAATDRGSEVRANFLLVESIDGEPSRVQLAGRYLDVVTEAGGRLRFSSKLAVYDSPMIRTSLIYPV
jgi:salicylate 5-hydroxylase small subunit